MKRHMPPLNHLRAFEAAVRHESFTKAAEELNVTQGAISRHIRTLEDYLGFELFQRENNNLHVALEIREFAGALTRAFDQINRASQALRQSKRRTVLTVRGYTNLVVRWLMPRLPEFQAGHPKIQVRLSAGRLEADYSRDDVDLEIRFGTGDWPGLHADPLFSVELVPVCSPALAERLGIRAPEDMLKATVFHTYMRKEDWPKWFAQVSDQPFRPAAEVFAEDPAVLEQCVIAGMGIGLVQRHYIVQEVAAGRLVVPFDVPLHGDLAFYLVCPRKHLALPKCAAFREWILSAAQTTAAA